MKVYSTLENQLSLDKNAVLTIGNFDGVHLGHQEVLRQVKEMASAHDLLSIVLTFQNHPSVILQPDQQVPLICTPQHKIKLLKEQGIDATILLPFTKDFSLQTAEEFLRKVHHIVLFTHLILGHDATMGRERQGNPDVIRSLGKTLQFKVDYLPEFTINNKIMRSSRVREAILKGDFAEVSNLLGRNYSIFSHVKAGRGYGKKIGFPTANIELMDLCLPPFGVYIVEMQFQNHLLRGVANLGFAPTLRNDKVPLLEVHLLDHNEDIYNQNVEIFFLHFLRPEKKFDRIDLLKDQIAQDILQTESFFNQKE